MLAEFACCNVIFDTFDGFFKQIDGLSMGIAPAPHLANGWLSQFDDQIRGNSSHYFRYMDDVSCISKIDNIDMKLDEINTLHPFLKFTVEKKSIIVSLF